MLVNYVMVVCEPCLNARGISRVVCDLVYESLPTEDILRAEIFLTNKLNFSQLIIDLVFVFDVVLKNQNKIPEMIAFQDRLKRFKNPREKLVSGCLDKRVFTIYSTFVWLFVIVW